MSRFQMFLIIGVSALLWPVIQLLVFYLRFGLFDVQPPVLMFLPMGAIAGGFLVYWLDEAKANQKKLLTLLGCVVASPIAFIGSIGGGLTLPAQVGATLVGALPLIIGSFFGFQLGRAFPRNEPTNSYFV